MARITEIGRLISTSLFTKPTIHDDVRSIMDGNEQVNGLIRAIIGYLPILILLRVPLLSIHPFNMTCYLIGDIQYDDIHRLFDAGKHRTITYLQILHGITSLCFCTMPYGYMMTLILLLL
jgi:hypothetical protein